MIPRDFENRTWNCDSRYVSNRGTDIPGSYGIILAVIIKLCRLSEGPTEREKKSY